MPSRQSWSKAIGSSPRSLSCSLRVSSISRNDMSSEMPSTAYDCIEPDDWASF